MTDFAEAGELGVFIDEEQLAQLEAKMERQGVLQGADMATTFNMLRANDLIWSFVVNNYLLGNEPFQFDLLYWNSDATRMPATMHSYYLRNMYHANRLAKGELELAGERDRPRHGGRAGLLHLHAGGPHRAVAQHLSRHAAAGRSQPLRAGGERAHRRRGEPAGRRQVQPLDQRRPAADPEEWFAGAQEMAGSWWPDWHRWVSSFANETVPARVPGEGKLPAIEDAPGSYVLVKA